ncbi:MAG: ABC transporter ATP-binding protein [Chitinophagaceae bacterium]|nr:MAG: ABC transporter ATP-binding protein [Chitinophagaceae bacterium]
MENILSVRHLKKYFEAHKAVDDISFDISKGNIFGLLGPNGAGKTTLLRMITGIFYPDEGEIFLNGEPFVATKDISQIGYMPEERGLYKKMKIGEQILYLAQLRGMSYTEARRKALFWIKRFELTSWWDKKVGDLSKGMQQKVQFISTILHEPRLLILDEPFSGLDPINTNLIKEEIFELARKGTTIIFSTHRMEQVEEICRNIVLVNKGKKILDGPVDQIKQNFKKHEFSITLSGIPEEIPEQETTSFLIEKVQEQTLIIKLKEGSSNNEVLQYFMQKGYGINNFREILPGINEVFIEQVEKNLPEDERRPIQQAIA